MVQGAKMLAGDHKKRFRSGQTRERIPSNAWARKIAAPTKPITAVIVSNIATSFTPLRDRKRRPPCTVKKISGHQHTIPIDRGFCATDVDRLVIERQEFGISRHAEHLAFMTVMLVMKRGVRGYIG